MDRRISVLASQLQELAVVLEEQQVELYHELARSRRFRRLLRRERDELRRVRRGTDGPERRGERATERGHAAGA